MKIVIIGDKLFIHHILKQFKKFLPTRKNNFWEKMLSNLFRKKQNEENEYL